MQIIDYCIITFLIDLIEPLTHKRQFLSKNFSDNWKNIPNVYPLTLS